MAAIFFYCGQPESRAEVAADSNCACNASARGASSDNAANVDLPKLLRRDASASNLMADSARLSEQNRILCKRIESLASKPGGSTSSWSAYQTLFQQYKMALDSYNNHRKLYFEHLKSFHGNSNAGPEMIAGDMINDTPQTTASQTQSNGSDSSKVKSPSGATLIKIKVEEKCAQLMALEKQLIASETRLSTLVSNLVAAQSKEGPQVFAQMWTDAQNLAMENRATASQYNHLGIQKSSKASGAVHDLIEQANRDGAYTAHMKAYKELSDNDKLQQQIYQNANKHGQFAMMMLSQLSSMRPPASAFDGGVAAPGIPGQSSVSSVELRAESADLAREYEQLQSTFQKLEKARVSLPANLRGKSGNI